MQDFSIFEPQVDDLNSKRIIHAENSQKFDEKIHEGDRPIPATDSNFDMEQSPLLDTSSM